MSSSGRKIILESSDKESFEVEEAVALESQTIRHMIEDECAHGGIPLPNVSSKILSKVIEYCKRHVDADSASPSPTTSSSPGTPSSSRSTRPPSSNSSWRRII
ncbi:hypothetical protein BT93_F0254 [Corymbia citriodora subsp. variegata]|nr:hypothetical protein BT93_F0254 [Corymbia citriodora subsp. variegata]